MYSLLLALLAALPGRGGVTPPLPSRFADAPAIAAKIDELAAKHWQAEEITPADLCPDHVFLRRVTLDLAGRIPTMREAKAFAEEQSPDKRARAVRRLMESPEYALHLGRVLDEIVQGQYAGDDEFLEYARTAVATRKPWDQVFREVMLGPWDRDDTKGAEQFLLKRIKKLDDLTTDTSRVFFGVNVSCAKCHDHPLVYDWKQDHYYGMQSFFNRTTGGKKGKGVNITEKKNGDVTFLTTKGERRTAQVMFLSGKVIEEPKDKKISRRELLVNVSLEQKQFFSRAIVNQLWNYFLGRGLVHPIDQMHSANPPTVPGLLEWLGDDLAGHGYDLDRLVAGIVSSRVYQLASKGAPDAAHKDFARAQLRPLTPYQYAASMVLAAGEIDLDSAKDAKQREKLARDLEKRAAQFVKSGLLDPRGDKYQASTGEALYLTNHPDVQQLIEPKGKNLTARLAAMQDAGEVVDTAVWTLFGRPPRAEEREFLTRFVNGKPDRAKACRQLVWALMTSAEFRFNH